MRFFLLALGLGLLAGCAAAPEKEEAAMPMDTICEANECAAVHMFDGPAGEPVFAPVFSGDTCTLEELPRVLRDNAYRCVSISSWARHADNAAVIDSLLRAGIGINMFYVLTEGRKDWDRQDLIGRAVPEPEEAVPARPPLTVRIIEDNAYNRRWKRPGPLAAVETITIHNTANKVTAIEERNYLNNRRDNTSISFHYAVDEKEAIQIMPLKTHAWHAGDGHGKGNMESIAIEICRSTHPDLKLYEKSEANAVILAAMLLKKFHLTTKDLRMHQDWSGKKCPHRIIEANSWEDFKKRVAKAMKAL